VETVIHIHERNVVLPKLHENLAQRPNVVTNGETVMAIRGRKAMQHENDAALVGRELQQPNG
jgi:hypothetical protein